MEKARSRFFHFPPAADAAGTKSFTAIQEELFMKYVCNVCGWVYDEEEAGVKWEDLPEDFVCELCGVGKEDFTEEA